MFAHKYRYLFILALSIYTLINTLLCEVYRYFHIPIAWYFAFLTIFLVTLAVWEGNRVIEQFFSPPGSTHKVKQIVYFFLAGNMIAAASTCAIVAIVGVGILHNRWQENIEPLKLNIIYAILVNLFFHLLNTIFVVFRDYKAQWMVAEELRTISTQAQIQLVRSQVNPHFLFNNLNVLSTMVVKDNPEANEFVEEFAKVYRYILNNQDKELVHLESELAFIQPYIFLLKKRFVEGLEVQVNIHEKFNHYFIIPVALQMLIENAIKHNVVSRARPLKIKVFTNGSDYLTVSNNLQPRQTTEASTQIGLKNISKRYQLVNGSAVLINKTTDEFQISIPLLSVN